jgi:hypothetical protein
MTVRAALRSGAFDTEARCRHDRTRGQRSNPALEHAVKVHHILLLIWVIVFAMWVVKQFSEHNKRTDKD